MELFFNYACLKPISWILVETLLEKNAHGRGNYESFKSLI